MVVMATVQGIDSSTGISGLDGPCIEAEIFCPVKSKHILQCTRFHTYLDHQSGFFLSSGGEGRRGNFSNTSCKFQQILLPKILQT